MFSKRLRLTLAAVFATATVVTTTVGVAAPAHATPGTTCEAPSVSGSITRTYNPYYQRYVYTVDNTGWTTASCPNTYSNTDYRYELAYYVADHQGYVGSSATDEVASTSLTPVSNRMNGARIGTRIEFPDAQYFEAPYFGYSGVYVFVRAYSKSRFVSSWSSDPIEVQSYFLPGTGDFDTHGMNEQVPRNTCKATGFRGGKC